MKKDFKTSYYKSLLENDIHNYICAYLGFTPYKLDLLKEIEADVIKYLNQKIEENER